jgi:hypothetical protein
MLAKKLNIKKNFDGEKLWWGNNGGVREVGG